MNIVIAGGGVAGLEALLGLHAIGPAYSTTPPEGVRVARSVRLMRGAEGQYLRDLARRYRADGPVPA